MSNEAFREFLKRDKLPRKHPVTSEWTKTKPDPVPVSNLHLQLVAPPKQSVQDLAGTITDPSACIVQIRNRLPLEMTHPRFYCCYGKCISPPLDIGLGCSGTFAFSHTSPLVSGLFSYRIQEKFLWVLYSSYEDRNFFSLAITPTDLTIGVELFVSMATTQDWRHKPDKDFLWAKKGSLTIQSENLLVSGKMTSDVRSILEIEMSSSL
ncbi:unnamed protein product [Allacma fusca]|uniref:Uncharacterized protein n=1 Tax=Allacma fusca TaxID=39272 RepID=A0A8J2KM24_9HEXA|nr:unnamed protein product [Allacma fusca]